MVRLGRHLEELWPDEVGFHMYFDFRPYNRRCIVIVTGMKRVSL